MLSHQNSLKRLVCNFYLCQQVVLYAKKSTPPHKAFSAAIYKQVCEVRPECPPPQPLCPQKPYQPLPKSLHTHSQNFPPARIDFSTTLMRSVSRMSHPPSSSPLLLLALFPFLSVHFSLHALQLCSPAPIVCFLHLSLFLQLIHLKKQNLLLLCTKV